MILEKIDALRKEVENLQATSAEELEQLRLKYLSKKGEMNALMEDSAVLPPTRRRLSA